LSKEKPGNPKPPARKRKSERFQRRIIGGVGNFIGR
jgi:hypothetical protein